MPIKSYLAHAVEGQRDQLGQALRALEGCAIVPATNRDVVVLVTDTADESAEQDLQESLARVPGLQCLTLVAGFGDTGGTPLAEDADDPP